MKMTLRKYFRYCRVNERVAELEKIHEEVCKQS